MFADKTFEKYRALEELKHHQYKYIGRSYFDSPEGVDLFTKLLCTTRWAFLGGFAMGACAILAKPRCKTYSEMFLRLSRQTIPPVALTTVFTVTVYTSTNFRKVDDVLNYSFAGIATGIVMGTMCRSTRIGLTSSLLLSVMGPMVKDDITVYSGKMMAQKQIDPYWQRKLDFTLFSEKEGEWKLQPDS